MSGNDERPLTSSMNQDTPSSSRDDEHEPPAPQISTAWVIAILGCVALFLLATASTQHAEGNAQMLAYLAVGLLAVILFFGVRYLLDFESKQREAAQALRATRSLLRTIVDESPDIIMVKNWDGRFVLGNQRLADFYGTTTAALPGKTDADFNPNTAQVEAYTKNIREIMRRGETQIVAESSTEVDSGEERHFLSIKKPLTGPNGERHILVVARDITDRHLAEKRERELDSIISKAGEGFWDWNITTNELRHNDQWHEILAYDPSHLKGTLEDFESCLLDEEKQRIHAAIEACLNQNQPYRIEHRMRRRDGQIIWVLDRGHIIERDENGRPTRMAGVLSDISERKAAEMSLRTAKEAAEGAVRTKSLFVANMSHEIRTPLNGVLGMIQLLEDSPMDEEQREFLAIAHRSANALLATVNDILDFSRVDAGEMRLESAPFSLFDVAEDVIEVALMSASGKGLELAWEAAPNVPEFVLGDVLRFRQVLTNLVGNAIKFTDEGCVSMRFEVQHQGSGDTAHLRVYITDTGIGIAPHVQQQLFQPFMQADSSVNRRFGGTGLGLSICKRLIELMGGAIGVNSVQGVGSTFWVRIPVQPVPAAATVTPQEPATILVAEPFQTARGQITGPLRRWGFKVVECEDWNGLIEAAPSAKAAFVLESLPGLPPDADNCIRQLSIPTERLVCVAPARAGHALPCQLKLTKPARRSHLLRCLTRMGLVAPPPADERPASPPAPGGGAKVLVVDDLPVNQRVAGEHLARLGHTAMMAASGLAAIETLRTHPDIALVLMDTQLPELDGLSTTEQIRAGAAGTDIRNVPIVAFTGDIHSDRVAACEQAGMNGVLEKPLQQEALAAILNRWIHALDDQKPAARAKTRSAISRKAEQLPAIDLDQMRDRLLNDEELIAQVVTDVRREAAQHFNQLSDALARDNADAAALAAHSLKSTVQLISAHATAHVAQEIETACRGGMLDIAKDEQPILEQMLITLLDTMNAHFPVR